MTIENPCQGMSELEWNRRREKGWNPPSPEDVPTIRHGEPIAQVSAVVIVGYHWSEKIMEDVLAEGQTLDTPENINDYGHSGSKPIEGYGEGYVYTHRDITEALALWDWMDRGFLYEVVGYGVDRLNTGLVSGGSLDQIERIFPVSQIQAFREITREDAEAIPTLYQRWMKTRSGGSHLESWQL